MKISTQYLISKDLPLVYTLCAESDKTWFREEVGFFQISDGMRKTCNECLEKKSEISLEVKAIGHKT